MPKMKYTKSSSGGLDMEPLGILLYGYSKTDSTKIKGFIETELENELILISGSKKEEQKVIEILENAPDDSFEAKENKILLFLGFNDDQINKVITNFPTIQDIKRPIFCGLTEQNVNWTMKYLIEHLLKEDRHWKGKKKDTKNNPK